MEVDNQNAWPKCRDDDDRIACLASAMRRLGDNCTAQNLKVGLGITQRELDKYADRARAKAAADSVYQRIVRVPAGQEFHAA